MIRVAELVGAQLDYWVARASDQCEGITFETRDDHIVGMADLDGARVPCIVISSGNMFAKMRLARQYDCMVYEPSAIWTQGGPIIERERITIDTVAMQPPLHWRALARGSESFIYADTPLVAAMRAFVASKFGAEVTPDRAAAQESARQPTQTMPQQERKKGGGS